ncbi:WD40 repeat domain-containing protein [Candidatus Dependentiae bacterium]|nr:WD40 repeat domain-containing protein [Candidatus Dependentiae bacterium]
MKKTLSLALLLITSFTYPMETDIVNPEVMKVIQKDNPNSTFIKESQSPDGTRIVALTNKGVVALYDAKTGKFQDLVATNKMNVQSLEFNPEGTKVILKTTRGTEEYGIVDPEVMKIIQENNPNSTFIKKSTSPDGTRIVALNDKGVVGLYKGKTGKFEDIIGTNKTDIQSLEFSPEGTKVILKTARGTEEYGIVDPEVLKVIIGDNSYTTFLNKTQSPDGTKIAALTQKGVVALYDGKTGKFIRILATNKMNVQLLEFNPDGTKVILKTTRGTEEFII